MAEEVLLCEIQIVLWMRIAGMFLEVCGLSSYSVLFLSKKARGYKGTGSSRSYDVKAEESVEGHAYSNCSRFQPQMRGESPCMYLCTCS